MAWNKAVELAHWGGRSLYRPGKPLNIINIFLTGPSQIPGVVRKALAKRSLTENVMMALTIIVWVSYARRNFQPMNKPTVTYLDSAYRPSSRLEIVISMYDESPEMVGSTIAQLLQIPAIVSARPSLTIYSKLENTDLKDLAARTGATNVFQIPNRGREGETYLHHILTRWDHLARHTLFMQADVHNSRELFPRIKDYFVDATGMLSLGFSGTSCRCDRCGDRWGWFDVSSVIPDVYRRVYKRDCSTSPTLLTYKGQFIASAARI